MSSLAPSFWQKLPYRWTLAICLASLIGQAAGRRFLTSVCVVTGTSMMPAFPSGTCLFTVPISTPLARGDVVLLDDGEDEYAIKRIVGLPGETVQFWRGMVFVDRLALREPYVPRKIYTYPRKRMGTIELGEGQYFVLGDNRLNSVDSRAYGPVRRDHIKRRIPLSSSTLRPAFEPYTLPAPGEVLVRPIASKRGTASNF